MISRYVLYISIFIVNSTALYVEQSVWGTKLGVGQSNGGEKPRHCAGYVTKSALGEIL